MRDLNCKEAVERFTDLIESALTPEEREEIERHLAGCSGCRNYLEQLRITIRILRKFIPEEQVDAVGQALLRELEAARRMKDEG